MPKTKLNIIKPAVGKVTQMPDGDLLARLNAVHDGMLNNLAYPAPPVDMAGFKAGIDAYTAAAAAALDGGKSAMAERDKRRKDVIIMLRLLAHYVEAACKNDMKTFLSSGFVAASRGRTPAQPVAATSIVRVDQGKTGQLLVTIQAVARRFAAVHPYRGRCSDAHLRTTDDQRHPGRWIRAGYPARPNQSEPGLHQRSRLSFLRHQLDLALGGRGQDLQMGHRGRGQGGQAVRGRVRRAHRPTRRRAGPAKEVIVDTYTEILRALGRIEGELVEIRKLSERVRKLEMWQSWLKGGWAALVGAYVYLSRLAFGK